MFRKIYLAIIAFFRRSWRAFWGIPINAKAARAERRKNLEAQIVADIENPAKTSFSWSEDAEKLPLKVKTKEVIKKKVNSKYEPIFAKDSNGVPTVTIMTKNGRRSFLYCEHKRAIREGYPCIQCTGKKCEHGWVATTGKPCIRCSGKACEHGWIVINDKKCLACAKAPQKPKEVQKIPQPSDFPKLNEEGNKFSVLKEVEA